MGKNDIISVAIEAFHMKWITISTKGINSRKTAPSIFKRVLIEKGLCRSRSGPYSYWLLLLDNKRILILF